MRAVAGESKFSLPDCLQTGCQRADMGTYYYIYIEDYVLSYLKREVDSLELSEIFFYGKRESGGRKLLVYGAGREKNISVFANYELLDELVCRLTQAGPVFMVREKTGDYKVNGFQTFYANNEAMQNYLIEWTSGEGEIRKGITTNCKRAEPSAARETSAARASYGGEGKGRTGSAMSVQLCLILVVLVAIVISSTNSYHKMERLNQSAKEVFFAIENQEAGQEDNATDTLADNAEQEKQTEILVERDTRMDDISVEDAVRAENAAQAQDDDQAGEGASTPADASAQTEEGTPDLSEDSGQAEENANTDADTSAQAEETQDSSEEALSRNITRYYEVEKGDTLYTISQKIYGDTSRVEKICEVNQISDPDKIRSGQKIILP